MIPYCVDQGIGFSVFSPLARGVLTNDLNSTRNKTDFFTAEMYNDQASLDIAYSVAKVAQSRGCSPAQVAQAWVLNKSQVSSMLVGADTKEQFDSALTMTFSESENFEIERSYRPCDLINDYTSGKHIPSMPRPAQDFGLLESVG